VTREGFTIAGRGGSIRVEADALSALVVAAAERVDGARVRRPRRGLDVSVGEGRAAVELELAARLGLPLPALGRAVQESVAAALRDGTGLEVAAVDIAIEELDG
jgi:uncharacterized alkaline shock family protein YloU